MVAQRPESSIRQCFSGRCGRFSGGQGKTGLGPRVSGHQRQSPACFLQARSHARLVYGENSRRHRWRLFQHEGLPIGPSWPDVQRLIAITAGKSARDIRDRAILILLATYGLRSSEVSGLRLEDVNWESEKVSIGRSKQRRAQEYPLVSEEDSLWSCDLFRCESATLRTHWVLVVMDQFTRRIIGFGVHNG